MFYTGQEKSKIVGLISKAGLPIKKAYEQYGISNASFYTWRKKLAADVGKKQEPVPTKTGCDLDNDRQAVFEAFWRTKLPIDPSENHPHFLVFAN